MRNRVAWNLRLATKTGTSGEILCQTPCAGQFVNITQISRSTKAHTSSIRTKHIIIPPRAAARGGAALRTPLPTFHQQPVLIARVPRYPAQIFSIFRLPLRLHLLHELQLPSVIRHNNKTNKQQQNQKESFIIRGQDRPSQYIQGGLGGAYLLPKGYRGADLPSLCVPGFLPGAATLPRPS